MASFPDSQRIQAWFFLESQFPDLAHRVLNFRKQVLVDSLGWDLRVTGNAERDEFDHNATVHVALLRDGEIIGSFRALRADQPYLSASKFPQLATERSYTNSPDAWEISRLTVGMREQRFETSLLIYATMFQFIRLKNARSIVGFCDLAHQRLLERIGIETRPYGEAQVIGADQFGRPIKVVAGEMPLPEFPSPRFQNLMSFTERMEIYDETTICRPARLSA